MRSPAFWSAGADLAPHPDRRPRSLTAACRRGRGPRPSAGRAAAAGRGETPLFASPTLERRWPLAVAASCLGRVSRLPGCHGLGLDPACPSMLAVGVYVGVHRVQGAAALLLRLAGGGHAAVRPRVIPNRDVPVDLRRPRS